MSIQSVLNDPSITPFSLESIYGYQIEGEALEWSLENQSSIAPDYFEVVDSTVEKIDEIIDLDFLYVSNYSAADVRIRVRDYSQARDQDVLGTFVDQGLWGEILINYNIDVPVESNTNTFVHELGHYLGLGEPAFDPRFDQSDTAMSYNYDPSLPGGFSTFFTDNDIAVLLELHSAEDDKQGAIDNDQQIENTYQQILPYNVLEGGEANDKLVGTDDDDLILGYEGNDKIFGDSGDDLIWGGSGRNRLRGGAGSDGFIKSDGMNVVEDFSVKKDFLAGFSSFPDFYDKSGKHVVIADGGSVFKLRGVDYEDFVTQIKDHGIFFENPISFL